MLSTLIKKEILDSFLTFRFLFGALVCLIVIPLGIAVNVKEYERRKTEYQDLERLYGEERKGVVGRNFTFEGHRPPSVLGIFAGGLENVLPNKVTTDKDAGYTMEREPRGENPESVLFGRMDLLFNAGFIVSLLAFILTFSSISGEKEEGTLRLVLSNPVARSRIILAKAAGSYILVAVPFTAAFLAGLIIVSASGVAPVFTPGLLGPITLLFGTTLLFTLSTTILGVLCSSLTHRARTSLVVLLLVWALVIFSWPRVSPMIAGILYPVKSQEVHNFEKMLARQSLLKEMDAEGRKLFDNMVVSGYGLTMWSVFSPKTDLERRAHAAYDSARTRLVTRYDGQIATRLTELDKEYSSERAVQSEITKNLSRLSPLCCYTYIMTDISSTGTLEMKNFTENSARFQDNAREAVYDRIVEHLIAGTNTEEGSWTTYKDHFDPMTAPLPHFVYLRKSLTEALSAVWPDILLLALYSLVFFVFSYVRFLRYDAR